MIWQRVITNATLSPKLLPLVTTIHHYPCLEGRAEERERWDGKRWDWEGIEGIEREERER